MKRSITIIILILIIVSCNHSINKYQLPGIYVFNDWGHDTLELKADGTYYFHTFISGKLLRNTGEWNLDSNGREITFDNFSFLTGELPRGMWISRIRVKKSRIQLMYANDINKYFEKLDNLK